MKPEFLRLCIILFVLALVIFIIISAKATKAKPYKRINLLYAIITAFCFGIAGLTGYLGLIHIPFYYFIVIQILLLIIGILHVHFMYRFLPWTSRSFFWWEFLFGIMISSLGAVFMLLAFAILKFKDHNYLMLSAIVWFFIPWFVVQAEHRFRLIPAKIFKKWVYPVGQHIPDPSDSDLASLIVISFDFQKKNDDPEITSFRAKAPKGMQFGKLFYFFINDYNEKNSESTIEVVNNKNNSFEWIFYFKPKWYCKRKYINPDESVHDNHIRENSIIVCQRTKES